MEGRLLTVFSVRICLDFLPFTYKGDFGTIPPAPFAGSPFAGVPMVRRFPVESSWVMEDVLFSKECLT